jgi:hypothetical protein
MAQLFIACTKCGDPLPVDSEVLKNAIALGEDLNASHEVCPGQEPAPSGDGPVLRRFRCELLLVEIGDDVEDPAIEEWAIGMRAHADAETDLLSAIGHTVHGRNFAEAVNGPVTTWLNKVWPQLQEGAAFADLPTTSDT